MPQVFDVDFATPSRAGAMMARPSRMTSKMRRAVIDGLANGESLVAICSPEDMPHRATVIRHVTADEKFGAAYRQAREIGAEVVNDMALEAAKGVYDRDGAAAARARADIYFKYAARIAPKRFNDQHLVKVAGVADEPVQVEQAESPTERFVQMHLAMLERLRIVQTELGPMMADFMPGGGGEPPGRAQDHRGDENGPAGDQSATPPTGSSELGDGMTPSAVAGDAGGGNRPAHDPSRLRVIGGRMARPGDIAEPGQGSNAFDVKDEARISADGWYKK